MTRQLLAMLGCYTLGLVAGSADKTVATSQQVPAIQSGQNPDTSGHVESQKPAKIEQVAVIPAIKTPLVEKVLPKSEPATVKDSLTVQDGQLSPRGEWQWSQAQVAWVPVQRSGPRWVENGHSATVDHLVRDHGYKRADLVKLTQAQLDVLHSNAHNSARARRVSAPTYSSCPSGRCPRR